MWGGNTFVSVREWLYILGDSSGWFDLFISSCQIFSSNLDF